MRRALFFAACLSALCAADEARGEVRLALHVDVINGIVAPYLRGPGLALQGSYHLPFGFFVGARVGAWTLWETFRGVTPQFAFPGYSRVGSFRGDAEALAGYERQLGARVLLAAGAMAGARVGFEGGTYTHDGESVTTALWAARFAAHAFASLSVRISDHWAASLLLRVPLFQLLGEVYETSLVSIGVVWRE
jgi:hypothetical protein